MLKSKCLSTILEVNITTLIISKLGFSFIFLEFIVYLRASSQNFVENHKFNVILLYLEKYIQKIVQYHLLAHYLQHLLEYAIFS